MIRIHSPLRLTWTSAAASLSSMPSGGPPGKRTDRKCGARPGWAAIPDQLYQTHHQQAPGKGAQQEKWDARNAQPGAQGHRIVLMILGYRLS